LSAENWTVSIEQKLRDALAAIHDLGMIHGDVRLENILIGKAETVWFLDFETAFLADSIALAEARKAMFQEDESRLNGCFNSVRPQKS
jgi:thiamine kinase-like enzyme